MGEFDDEGRTEFEAGAEARRTGLAGEFWEFLKHNKKWWLTPILVVFALLIVLVFAMGSPIAPFIYTLF